MGQGQLHVKLEGGYSGVRQIRSQARSRHRFSFTVGVPAMKTRRLRLPRRDPVESGQQNRRHNSL